MRKIRVIFTAIMMCVSMLASAIVDVTWKLVENREIDGNRTYIQRFTVKNHYGLSRLCFNMFARKMEAVNPADKVVEIVPGYYYIESSRFGESEEPVEIDIEVKGKMTSCNYAPDGLHGVSGDGHLIAVKYCRNSLMDSDKSAFAGWATPSEKIYELNASLADSTPLSPYEIIPSFKSVTMGEGTYTGGLSGIRTAIISNDNPEYYRIIVSQDSVRIEGASEPAVKMAQRVLVNNVLPNSEGGLPCAVIEDYPDFHYRGLMIDVSRNFLTLPEVQKIVYSMASLRLNRLHFHITDDEGWRLEIPGLPELTAVGARRGYTTTEDDYTAQIFAGNGDPNNTEGTANGYYTREEFIQFIRFCHELGVEVIPEIESPGHARAAVLAMESRYRKTGDDTYRLREEGDTSRYTSAQSFHDNLMNPALPGPYRFMEKVIDEVAAMYREAGVPLLGIHIGGDEVPNGAWDGSPSAQKMMQELKISGRHLMQGEFVRRIARMMRAKGIKMYGWQEIGVGYDEEFNAEVAPATGGVNCWLTNSSKLKNVPLRAVNAGFPVILSNVEHYYMDQIYDYHPEERGLYWGGCVDEFKSLNGYPYSLCPADGEARGRVLGIQGQLFAETVRNLATVQTHLFPKVYGLAERAWNADTTYSNSRFNHIIYSRMLPRLAASGTSFHLRAPGMVVKEGKVEINSPYPGAVIRYTTDGSEPTENSAEYVSPISARGEVRAALYYMGERSVTVSYTE